LKQIDPDKNCPTLHVETGVTQADTEILPIGDIKPSEHVAQISELDTILETAPSRAYLFAGHDKVPLQDAVERATDEPYNPAEQFEQSADPLNEYEPSGQGPLH